MISQITMVGLAFELALWALHRVLWFIACVVFPALNWLGTKVVYAVARIRKREAKWGLHSRLGGATVAMLLSLYQFTREPQTFADWQAWGGAIVWVGLGALAGLIAEVVWLYHGPLPSD